MTKLSEKYNALSNTYDDIYVQGGYENNPYMYDEYVASQRFKQLNWTGKVISIGCGTGQDYEITGCPSQFIGYDISIGMLEKARLKFPHINFIEHDCTQSFTESADILVSMFGTPNYIGADCLLMHYNNLSCKHAFFVFYNENYVDGISDDYYRYTKDQLTARFPSHAVIDELWPGSNYYITYW